MAKKNLNLGVDIKQVQQFVLNSEINLGQLVVDPITAEQQARYNSEGLTYISNNSSIIPRDAAGNIMLDENSTSNPLLVIDPVAELITTKSALRVLDTRFQYYKFPVTIRPTAEVEDLVVDLDFESDTIAARYTIPAGIDDQGQPVTLQRIATRFSDDWFTNGGEETAGTSRMPFVGGQQSEIGSYTITPEILDTLRSKNKTLKFTIQAQFNTVPNANNQLLWSTNKFFIGMSINRSMPEVWRSSGTLYKIRTEAPEGSITDGSLDYPYFKLDYVVDIFNDAAPYDKYFIDVSAGARAWLLADNCWWRIDVIDIPTTPSLNGDIGTGVYSFNESSNYTILTEINEKTFFDSEVGSIVTRVIPTDIYKKIDGLVVPISAPSPIEVVEIPAPPPPQPTTAVTTNSASTASNPTGNVSEDIDETYPPYGEPGTVNGEVREYEENDIVIAYFEWDGFNQTWNQVQQ
jgi:hypothetical protein